MCCGDGLSHEPIRKIIELMKAGDYRILDQRYEILGTQDIYIQVGYRQNRESHCSINIESKNHKDLSKNDRSFRATASYDFFTYRFRCYGQFTDEEWEFFSNLKLPYSYKLKLDEVSFSLYE